MTEHATLPEPIAAYFAADIRDSEAFARCFTDDAVVKDEGHTYTGVTAIKQWKAKSATKFTYSSKPFAVEPRDGMVIVTSRLTGNFPGSPVNLRYCFGLERGKIASLEDLPRTLIFNSRAAVPWNAGRWRSVVKARSQRWRICRCGSRHHPRPLRRRPERPRDAGLRHLAVHRLRRQPLVQQAE